MVFFFLTEDGWCHPNCRRILANSFLSSLTAACKRLPDLLTSFDQDAFVVFTWRDNVYHVYCLKGEIKRLSDSETISQEYFPEQTVPFLNLRNKYVFLYSFLRKYLTNSTGKDPSMSLNSSRSPSAEINDAKWKNLTRSGISVNFPKSLRISGLDFSEFAEISIGVSCLFSQTAVGSTLGGKHQRLVKTKLEISPKIQQISNKVEFSHFHGIL